MARFAVAFIIVAAAFITLETFLGAIGVNHFDSSDALGTLSRPMLWVISVAGAAVTAFFIFLYTKIQPPDKKSEGEEFFESTREFFEEGTKEEPPKKTS